MEYRAVVFDFDGVIGNTMDDNYRAWSKAFSQHGISLAREEYFLLEGMSTGDVARTILQRRGMGTGLAGAIAEFKDQSYSENNSFEFYPGVMDILDALRGRFKLGLVSGAGSGRLRNSVSDDFLAKFGVVVTGDHVKNSKPHPEPYLLAIREFSVSPQECLAVENAPLGIRSAKSAGMDCVAVCSTLEREHLVEADFVVSRIDELAWIVRIELVADEITLAQP